MFKLTRSDGDLLEIMTKTENQVTTHAVLKDLRRLWPRARINTGLSSYGCVCKVW